MVATGCFRKCFAGCLVFQTGLYPQPKDARDEPIDRKIRNHPVPVHDDGCGGEFVYVIIGLATYWPAGIVANNSITNKSGAQSAVQLAGGKMGAKPDQRG